MSMKYNFDEIIERRGSDCLKYGVLKERWGRDDLLPLWVADMDFRTPHFIINAIRHRLDHEILGYTAAYPEWKPAIIDWLKTHHRWDVKPEEITFIPGIVRGIAFVIQALTAPGDEVMVFGPVYHPFFLVAEHNRRKVVRHRLIHTQDNRYEIDFERLRRDMDGVKVLIISNPHNPGGRVWTKGELQQIAHICKECGTLVISDEIHADLTFAPHKHVPFTSVSDEARDNAIVFGSPSKAFNCPGIVSSYSIIPNVDIRRRVNAYLAASELDEGNMFAQLVTVAAYSQGEEWLRQCKEYILGNIDFVEQWFATHMPAIRPMRPEASYLVYLDCHGLNLRHEQILDLFVDKAHLALDDGRKFGPEGDQYMRLNVGTPRAVLEEALSRLQESVKSGS